MKQYTTYVQLAAAFKSGELTDFHYLMLDKGAQENCLCYYNPNESEEVNELKSDEARKMWRNDPPIEEVFEAAGIRCEWC